MVVSIHLLAARELLGRASGSCSRKAVGRCILDCEWLLFRYLPDPLLPWARKPLHGWDVPPAFFPPLHWDVCVGMVPSKVVFLLAFSTHLSVIVRTTDGNPRPFLGCVFSVLFQLA